MKKKLLVIALVLSMVSATSLISFATDNETVLSTTVPAATYTLNIPADQTITFGSTSSDIGAITVTNAQNFASGKNVEVEITYSQFTSKDVSTTIPIAIYGTGKNSYDVRYTGKIESGGKLTFLGQSDTTVKEKASIKGKNDAGMAEDTVPVSSLLCRVSSEDWGKALGGDYSSTIKFTAKVVSNQQ